MHNSVQFSLITSRNQGNCSWVAWNVAVWSAVCNWYDGCGITLKYRIDILCSTQCLALIRCVQWTIFIQENDVWRSSAYYAVLGAISSSWWNFISTFSGKTLPSSYPAYVRFIMTTHECKLFMNQNWELRRIQLWPTKDATFTDIMSSSPVNLGLSIYIMLKSVSIMLLGNFHKIWSHFGHYVLPCCAFSIEPLYNTKLDIQHFNVVF